jgi:hypothetical protein
MQNAQHAQRLHSVYRLLEALVRYL